MSQRQKGFLQEVLAILRLHSVQLEQRLEPWASSLEDSGEELLVRGVTHRSSLL
jgi:hypothetical protein